MTSVTCLLVTDFNATRTPHKLFENKTLFIKQQNLRKDEGRSHELVKHYIAYIQDRLHDKQNHIRHKKNVRNEIDGSKHDMVIKRAKYIDRNKTLKS